MVKLLGQKIREVLEGFHSQGLFNGVAMAAVNDQPIMVEAFGHCNVESKEKLTPENKFIIGSLTKGFTAVAILQLAEEGKLNLDDKVALYSQQCPNGENITIHQLLSHTSGLPFNPYTQEEPRQPGSYRYSNKGYIRLGDVVEAVSGQGLDQYFKQNIFHPLDMDDTSFSQLGSEGLPTGYNRPGELAYRSRLDIAYPVRGCGGLCSNYRDMLKWSVGVEYGRLLSKESLEKMFTPMDRNYGYGWFIGKRPRRQWHTGTGAGFRSMLYRETRNSKLFTMLLMSNYQNTQVEKINAAIRKIIAQNPF